MEILPLLMMIQSRMAMWFMEDTERLQRDRDNEVTGGIAMGMSGCMAYWCFNISCSFSLLPSHIFVISLLPLSLHVCCPHYRVLSKCLFFSFWPISSIYNILFFKDFMQIYRALVRLHLESCAALIYLTNDGSTYFARMQQRFTRLTFEMTGLPQRGRLNRMFTYLEEWEVISLRQLNNGG